MTDRSDEKSKSRGLSRIFQRKDRGIKRRPWTQVSPAKSTAPLEPSTDSRESGQVDPHAEEPGDAKAPETPTPDKPTEDER